jgi:hypothetical protein
MTEIMWARDEGADAGGDHRHARKGAVKAGNEAEEGYGIG